MGMFDYIKIECELPCKVVNLEKAKWQTKDTPAHYLDEYFLTVDGRLEHMEYETRVEDNKDAPFGFYLHRDNEHRVFCGGFTGSIRFYDQIGDTCYEFCAFIEAGRILKIVHSVRFFTSLFQGQSIGARTHGS